MILFVNILITGASRGILTLNILRKLLMMFRPVIGEALMKWAMCSNVVLSKYLNSAYFLKIDLNLSKSVGRV